MQFATVSELKKKNIVCDTDYVLVLIYIAPLGLYENVLFALVWIMPTVSPFKPLLRAGLNEETLGIIQTGGQIITFSHRPSGTIGIL